LLIDGSPDQGRYPASEVNDGACPEKPVHLRSLYALLTFCTSASIALSTSGSRMVMVFI